MKKNKKKLESLSYGAPPEYLIKTLGFPASEMWRHGIGCAGFACLFFLFILGREGRPWRLKDLTWAPEENHCVDTCLCTASAQTGVSESEGGKWVRWS